MVAILVDGTVLEVGTARTNPSSQIRLRREGGIKSGKIYLVIYMDSYKHPLAIPSKKTDFWGGTHKIMSDKILYHPSLDPYDF